MASETKSNYADLIDQRKSMRIGDWCSVKSIDGKRYSTGWDNTPVWKKAFIREVTHNAVTLNYHVDGIYTEKTLPKFDIEQLRWSQHLAVNVEAADQAIKDEDTLLTVEKRLQYLSEIQTINPVSFSRAHSKKKQNKKVKNTGNDESKMVEDIMQEDSDDCNDNDNK